MWERNKKEIAIGISAVLALGAGTLWVATGSNGSQADAATGPVAQRIERPKDPDRGTGRIQRPRRPQAIKDDGSRKTTRPIKVRENEGKTDRKHGGPRTVVKHKKERPAA